MASPVLPGNAATLSRVCRLLGLLRESCAQPCGSGTVSLDSARIHTRCSVAIRLRFLQGAYRFRELLWLLLLTVSSIGIGL
jgi:hypothetical protein